MGLRGRTAPTAGPGSAEAPAARGRAERRRTARRATRRGRRSLLRELPLIAVLALAIAVALKTFFVQVFVIPSGSMEQTIAIGDRVLVDKLTPWFGSTPRRGDVVVFKDPGGWLENDRQPETDGPLARGVKSAFSAVGLLPSAGGGDLIKRVIGVAGDTVVCCDAQQRITVNGTPMAEPYLAQGNPASQIPFRITVPPGRLWVMGDHRDLSADSRYHMTGPDQGTVPLSDVVGRAFMIAWPFDRIGGIARPGYSGPAAQGPPKIPAGGPDPRERSLVMGLLGVAPAVLRRGRGVGPAARQLRSPAVWEAPQRVPGVIEKCRSSRRGARCAALVTADEGRPHSREEKSWGIW
ncbi:signal peptidase I [Kitasatospora acidiphila]|uniref:Signal peptidase I n=1 Tax=Kitasatospora acidiphila TaxID=2567942 RepID=A0A540W2U2_9ACTN|nr:signal peptidase I [Kitasatospora acidiphila]TQF03302.1 signal peptidase I [Kitasatospora acidiphila]